MNQQQMVLDLVNYLTIIFNISTPLLQSLIHFDHTAYHTISNILIDINRYQNQEIQQLNTRCLQLINILQYRIDNEIKQQKKVQLKYQYQVFKKLIIKVENKQIDTIKINKQKTKQSNKQQIQIIKKSMQLKLDNISDEQQYDYQNMNQKQMILENFIKNKNKNNVTNIYQSNNTYQQNQHHKNNSPQHKNIIQLNKLQYKKIIKNYHFLNHYQYHKKLSNQSEVAHIHNQNNNNYYRNNLDRINLSYCCKNCHNCHNNQRNSISHNQRKQIKTQSMSKKIHNFASNPPKIPQQLPNTQSNISPPSPPQPQKHLPPNYQPQSYQNYKTITPNLLLNNINNNLVYNHHVHTQTNMVISDYHGILQRGDYYDGYRRQDCEEGMLTPSKSSKKQRQALHLVKLPQSERKQVHDRQQNLLAKLKQQFSQINFRQSTDDQKKVQDQIKQLQLKLQHIFLNSHQNKTPHLHNTSPPQIKLIKLNISPTSINNKTTLNHPYISSSPKTNKTYKANPWHLSTKIQKNNRNRL